MKNPMLKLAAIALTACVGSVPAAFADYPEKPVSELLPNVWTGFDVG